LYAELMQCYLVQLRDNKTVWFRSGINHTISLCKVQKGAPSLPH